MPVLRIAVIKYLLERTYFSSLWLKPCSNSSIELYQTLINIDIPSQQIRPGRHYLKDLCCRRWGIEYIIYFQLLLSQSARHNNISKLFAQVAFILLRQKQVFWLYDYPIWLTMTFYNLQTSCTDCDCHLLRMGLYHFLEGKAIRSFLLLER